jgi:hypothetical protein
MNPELKLVIAYLDESGGVSIVYPASECPLSIKEIAEKDVPAGRPYMFVPAEAIPTDHTFFNAFELDFSDPSGYGIGAEAWFARQSDN